MRILLVSALSIAIAAPTQYDLTVDIASADHGTRQAAAAVHGYGAFTARGEGMNFRAFEFWANDCQFLMEKDRLAGRIESSGQIVVLSLAPSGGGQECSLKVVIHPGTGTFERGKDGKVAFQEQHHA